MGNRILIVHGDKGLTPRMVVIAGHLEDAGYDVLTKAIEDEIAGSSVTLVCIDELPTINAEVHIRPHYAHPEAKLILDERNRHPKHQQHPRRPRK